MKAPQHAIVVDDDPVSRTVLAAFLKAEHFEVSTATDGPSGLRMIEAMPSSLVLLDWVMPGMSGLEVCATIRAKPWNERPYIILTSGKGPDEIAPALAAGADDVLRKPFERSEVATRIAVARFVLNGQGQRSFTEALREAELAEAGEMVVRSGEVLARLAFQNGRLVWITVSPAQERLSDHLAQTLGLGQDELRAVFEDSRQRGQPFDALLVQWNLANEAQVTSAFRTWVESQLDRVRNLVQPSVLFAPMAPGPSMLRGFELPAIAPWLHQNNIARTRNSVAPPGPTAGKARELVHRAMDIDGAVAAFLLAPRDGTVLAAKGDAVHVEVAWSLERALLALPEWDTDTGVNATLSSGQFRYLGQVVSGDKPMVLVLVTAAKGPLLGRVLLELARLCAP